MRSWWLGLSSTDTWTGRLKIAYACRCSTLRAIFEGKRELFRGLKITKLKYDWKKRPVVMLNMAEVGAPTVDKPAFAKCG